MNIFQKRKNVYIHTGAFIKYIHLKLTCLINIILFLNGHIYMYVIQFKIYFHYDTELILEEGCIRPCNKRDSSTRKNGLWRI